MANPQQPLQPPVIDPDSIPETICDGQFNLTITGNLATLTFTHVRPDVAKMFKEGIIDPKSVVRARIVLTVANLNALRDVLNGTLAEGRSAASSTGGSTKH